MGKMMQEKWYPNGVYFYRIDAGSEKPIFRKDNGAAII
jgi:hypothetical protein